jgi:hypothetical protein
VQTESKERGERETQYAVWHNGCSNAGESGRSLRLWTGRGTNTLRACTGRAAITARSGCCLADTSAPCSCMVISAGHTSLSCCPGCRCALLLRYEAGEGLHGVFKRLPPTFALQLTSLRCEQVTYSVPSVVRRQLTSCRSLPTSCCSTAAAAAAAPASVLLPPLVSLPSLFKFALAAAAVGVSASSCCWSVRLALLLLWLRGFAAGPAVVIAEQVSSE